MAYTSQSASWSDIAAAVVEQLVTVTAIDPNLVRLVASDRYELAPIDAKYLVCRYYGPSPFIDAGAGRRARPIQRRIRVYCYTRSQLDQFADDVIALTAVDGHEALELQVMDALDEFWPSDDDGNLTLEPLHPLDSSGGPPERRPEDDIGFIRSHLDYEVRYLAKVQTPQP